MSDLISRQDAIDVIKGIDSYFVQYIEALPSAQQWIPCSERLPEKKGFYLVTTEERKKATMGFYEDIWFKAEKVIAWMPMPEPYREEDQND